MLQYESVRGLGRDVVHDGAGTVSWRDAAILRHRRSNGNKHRIGAARRSQIWLKIVPIAQHTATSRPAGV